MGFKEIRPVVAGVLIVGGFGLINFAAGYHVADSGLKTCPQNIAERVAHTFLEEYKDYSLDKKIFYYGEKVKFERVLKEAEKE